MRISTLNLVDFRNYTELFFTPSNGLNIIFGENAQGKTNLLEAVVLLSFGRSHRTPRDSELIRRGAEAASAELSVVSDDSNAELHRIRAYLPVADKKAFAVDGDRLNRLAELMGCLNVVLFSPESLLIVKGSAVERRRFLNMEISQLSRGYFYSLQRYNAALKQKNAVLKSADVYNYPEYAHAWNEQLAEHALAITKLRAGFISKLRPIAQGIFKKISDGQDELDIGYSSALGLDPSSPDAHEELMRALHDALPDDIKRGHSRIGPHRDELHLAVNGLDARVYASQGQQRALALALKLSEITLIEEAQNELPVVLLDDVFSELDTNRCRALLDYAERCQCIITCANSASVEMFSDNANVFYCSYGTLTV